MSTNMTIALTPTNSCRAHPCSSEDLGKLHFVGPFLPFLAELLAFAGEFHFFSGSTLPFLVHHWSPGGVFHGYIQ